MKRIIIILAGILLAANIFGQSPDGVKYTREEALSDEDKEKIMTEFEGDPYLFLHRKMTREFGDNILRMLANRAAKAASFSSYEDFTWKSYGHFISPEGETPEELGEDISISPVYKYCYLYAAKDPLDNWYKTCYNPDEGWQMWWIYIDLPGAKRKVGYAIYLELDGYKYRRADPPKWLVAPSFVGIGDKINPY